MRLKHRSEDPFARSHERNTMSSTDPSAESEERSRFRTAPGPAALGQNVGTEAGSVPGVARCTARSADAEPLQTTRFQWEDPETGERLELELWSSDDFRAELESVGFVRLAWETAAPRGGCTGGRNRVRPSAASTDDARTGSTPPAA